MDVHKGRLLAFQLAATCIASPLLIALLFIFRAGQWALWFFWPVLMLGRPIAVAINTAYPPQGGGWFGGLGTAIEVNLILAWIYLWALLMIVVKLCERYILKRREIA